MKNLTSLEKMYYEVSQDIPETMEMSNSLDSIIEIMGGDVYRNIEGKLMDCFTGYEMQGFLYGFKQGIGIRQECQKMEGVK